MKKLFTLVALLAVAMGAKAEWVEDYKIDYSTYNGFPFYVMGYVPEWIDGVMTDFGANYKYAEVKDDAEETSDVIVTTNNGVEYYKISLEEPGWHQYFIADGIPTEIDGSYTVTAMVKASEACTINVNMGWGWGNGEQTTATAAIGTEWTEVEWEYTGIAGTSCNLVAQPGGCTATIEWKWLKVGHNQKAQRPTEWISLLVNGDAEKDWSEVVPGGADTPDDDPENYLVCAWGKEYAGRDASNNNAEISHPHPAEIVAEADGNRVFVVRTKAVDPNEFPDFFLNEDGSVKGDPQWQNQFWIESPKKWNGGEQVKISFRYKASQATGAVNTQCHAATPGSYLHWAAIGDVTFSTDWQEFNQIITLPSQGAGMYSIAFNLGANDNWKEDIDYYFDDLYWGEMKLDHGYFVAGCNTQTGLSYDFDNAIEMVYNEDDELYVAVVGEKGKPATYVDQIMVSTVRGNDAMFKSSTLSVPNVVDDPDAWESYTEKAIAKLSLPGSGVWQVSLDEGYTMMNFVMLEGEVKEPIEVVANPTEFKIEALERDWKAEGEDGVGAGQPWDNQMWICANRTLEGGEATYLEFKYKATKEAKSSTQCHKEPGVYLHWAAIGDVNFGTDWQTAEINFTVPSEGAGMQTIAFNLAEIKEANDYYIKDVIWVVGSKEESYESLISPTGDQHIAWKVVGGDINSGIETINADSKNTVIFNLSGQRVNKANGLVISNGKIMFVK